MDHKPPADRSPATTFADRHIGPSDAEQAAMLAVLGYDSLDALVSDAVPAAIRLDGDLDLPPAASEAEAAAELAALAARNRLLTPMLGLGYHGTITPPVIRRNVLENPAWYTAYTPYQPEISQGRLEALVVFQTLVADLSAMALANASLLDEGTAAAEAMTLARRASKAPADAAFVIDADTHPHTIEVVRTRAEPLGITVVVAEVVSSTGSVSLPEGDLFGLLVQAPSSTGAVRDLTALADAVHERGGLLTVAADPLALCLLRPPGEMGADVVVGSTQRFGVPLGYGGPHAGYMAVREGLQRSLPGRLVGVSVDADGDPAYRLALQTREQHIRREKATSNICTAQVLLAVVAAMYAVYHGPEGLRTIASSVHDKARRLAASLGAGGIEVAHVAWFDTLTVLVPGRSAEVVAAALADGVNVRQLGPDAVGVTCDEATSEADLAVVCRAFGVPLVAADELGDEVLDGGLLRTSDMLTHPTFHRYRSETAMLRYLRRLADKDVALDRSMIPLGSCTMKLNATTEMEPISWPGFANLHPFAPVDQAEGYAQLVDDLERWLVEITGYDAVSLQPNAGSQGELAGLLAIREYHRSRGDEGRDVCLIPSSAHGTNAASAAMAGMRVVVVACDDDGNVDVDDLRAKLADHEARIAALMVTYPSTHGVFEEAIGSLCDLVHEAGGQVYLDGANLNAMVGLAKPGRFGADVSHLNLHKTFCIPHGGGGPGVGPIGVREHLAPFLPNHPLVPSAGPSSGPGPVSAAPWGSAGILPIPWAYIRMMGPDGLRRATEVAILNANYVARRLAEHYPVLYTGRAGLVAHECILDLRPLTKATGITVDDVAKRLIDYGIHAPTMSFPVAGTLMVEPTESEDLAELDRFCEAMIAIRREVDEQPEVLRAAPHTAACLLAAEWTAPYSRDQAAYPVESLRLAKYWPPVRRIDGGYGDRNLFCSCPPLTD
jgi:glycine dehydrogenase